MNVALAWLLLRTQWRAHPWRQVLALLAVALGVALAWSVHLINRSALSEFSSAVRAVQGEPDLSIACAQRSGCDDALADTLAARADVAVAAPLIEIDSYALKQDGTRGALRLMGIDALQVAAVAPALLPRAAAGESRLAALDPDAAFLNSAALERLGLREGEALRVQHGARTHTLRVAGSVTAPGPPLAVIDITAAQQTFGFEQRLTRIDVRLATGADANTLLAALPPAWRVQRADEAEQRVSNVSRAYRVNLTVLALVALFVGGFLVFAVQALTVAQRTGEHALLGVLGLSARERGALVLGEALLIGVLGSMLGIGAGTALARAALTWLAGDLGGGYFPGIAPTLHFDAMAAVLFAGLGVAAALAGSALPARQAASLAPAQALKGLGGAPLRHGPAWRAPLLLALALPLALAPPIADLPIAAYASVALLLLGGIGCVPLLINALLARAHPPRAALPLLALRRAHHERDAAAVAVAGVVASLALSVALTVMVASFREGVATWLTRVLPADLYLRSSSSSAAADQAYLPTELPAAAARLPGVTRVEASRLRALSLSPTRPGVTLIVRPLDDPASVLPMIGAVLPASGDAPGVFVSEAMQSLYAAQPGTELELPLGEQRLKVRVRGVWRDYARQFGAIAIDVRDYRSATGDERINDLALHLAPEANADEVTRALRALLPEGALVDIASTPQLRTLSLSIFDRSFAVTRYLQAVAIVIGLAGIAASFSAQVWARRREFGLLAHLGFTRAQVLALVAGEGALWTGVGALAGSALGLAVAVVLVHVVNPQSFHWTMELLLPWGRIATLAAAVLAAGTLTAALSARAAASRDVVASVKEDW